MKIRRAGAKQVQRDRRNPGPRFERIHGPRNYLRSSISQERFLFLPILSIESEVANFDDIKDLKKARKIN